MQKALILIALALACLGIGSFAAANGGGPDLGSYTNMTDDQAQQTYDRIHQMEAEACRSAGEQWDPGARQCTGRFPMPDMTGIEVPQPRLIAANVVFPMFGSICLLLAALLVILAFRTKPKPRRR